MLVVAAESSTPVWFEPVSVTKSKRVASVAKYVSANIFAYPYMFLPIFISK